MKNNHLNLFFLLITVISFGSCSTEEEYHSYTTAIRNTSNEPFLLLVLGNDKYQDTDTLINTIVKPAEIIFKNSYRAPSFGGLDNEHFIYYMKLEFENGKGYICDEASSPLETCFQSKRSFTTSTTPEDFTHENGVYYYDITQEDYENAHVLP